MSAQLRTVRLLDREPGKATETRVVHGITVERGVPLPKDLHGLGDVLAALEVGESFVYRRKVRIRQYAKKIAGKEYAVRKLDSGRYRIWRLK